MVSKKTVIALLGIIFALIVLSGLASTLLVRPSSSLLTNTGASGSSTDALTISFIAAPSVVAVGETTRVEVRVSPQSPPITVATVELKYDPRLLEVVQIDEGSLWNQQTQLENTFDNTAGVARITVGQGFDGQATGDNLIASYTFKAKAAGSAALSLGPKTLLARVGNTSALPVHAEPFALTVD